MINRKKLHKYAGRYLLVAFLAAGFMAPAHAEQPKPVSSKLTPRLKQLLSEEMQMIKQAMKQILDGLIVGDHPLVATNAEQIYSSYILARELTPKDKADLMKAPPEFLQLDGEFHEIAKKLAQAGKQKDYELQRFYYGRLVDSCQGCHSRYVTDKFPAFSGAQPGGHTH
ncbi:MAG: cytochrome c [Sulfuricaulis sp.]|uniref:hypothetical protein n=1 Tax=Sulfuricaulis sp. TaxID=2003553 RepID=UPI0025D722E5|nr:hypothetical protein [Sulfuricaulis sp.]MCR4347360.1 cytochrome c [Sulfuricaulis sp.]